MTLPHRRSILCCPATAGQRLEKAASSSADALLVDLEDSVPAADKGAARAVIESQIGDLDVGMKSVTVRINDPDTPDGLADLESVASGPPCIIAICIPKVTGPGHVASVNGLLDELEQRSHRPTPLGIEALIETAAALEQLHDIARAPRVCSLVFGPGDFAVSLGARRSALYDPDPALPDPFWFARLAVLAAARTAGVQAIDGPSVDLKGTSRLQLDVESVANAGFDGKWALHPAQLETINTAFSPSDEDVTWAVRVSQAAVESASAGVGALVVDGSFVDEATVKHAQRVLDRAQWQ
jgi:citrate lyase beta subunit